MKSIVRMFALGIALLAASAVSVSAQPKINDAQIAAIAVAANQVDVDAGKLALSKAQNGEIKQFAQTMITDHGGAIKAATDLVGKLKVTPQANDTSKETLVSGGTTFSKSSHCTRLRSRILGGQLKRPARCCCAEYPSRKDR